MPAASTPGIAPTRASTCWKMARALAWHTGRLVGGSVVVVIHLDGGRALGLEAEIHVENFEEAAQQQARAHQQHAGQRDLSDHQHGAQALVLAALARAGAGVLEGFLQIAAGHAQSGDEAEEHGREDGDQEGPAERGAVNVQRAQQRQGDGSLVREPGNEMAGQAEAEAPRRRRKAPGFP